MPLTLTQVSSELSPDELSYVMEKALVVGPFTIESVSFNDSLRQKSVVVKFRDGKSFVVEVPLWRVGMGRI